MNSNSHDNQDLTAYALGELAREQEHAMRAAFAVTPEMRAELAGIERITDALHQGAPVPTAKLNPAQRQAVFNPTGMPRMITPMKPRQPVVLPRRHSPVFRFAVQMAAAAAVAVGAFYLGQHFGAPVPNEIAAQPEVKMPEVVKSEATVVMPPKLTPPIVVQDAPKPAPLPEIKPAPAPQSPVVAVAPAPMAAPQVKVVAAPAPPVVAPLSSDEGFTLASKAAASKITVRPFETRPLPVKLKEDDQVLASALKPQANAPVAPKNDRKERAPDLLISSWKAEIAACPWNDAHRLLRVLVQLPADQPASISADNAYPLQVTFDPIHVRAYRLLSQHHARPEAGATTAAHVLWYEVTPMRATDTGRALATITMPTARFTSKAIEPFDDSKLIALDRGLGWRNARQDFLFETAIVGFKMLMQGDKATGNLDIDLVLALARQGAGDQPAGEAAKFIRAVQEAKRVIGQ